MELHRLENGELEARLPHNFSFKITSIPGEGRALVATREIKHNEVVLTDSAILLGPASPDVCIVCCRGQNNSHCPSCHFLLCPACLTAGSSAVTEGDEIDSSSHSGEECALLVALGYNENMYNVVLPLRFGLLRYKDKDMFDWLLQYMDHNHQRTHQNPHIQNTVDRLAVIVTSLIRGIGLEIAKRMVGVLFTNCFQFSTRDIEARALYPLVSLVNHSCIPNLSHTNLIQELVESDGEILVMQLETQRTVKPGTQLTIRYSDYTQGHLQRQKFLWEQWYFSCHCPRCSDPTEFGTRTSGLPCLGEGCSGLLLPRDLPVLGTNPPLWQCTVCTTQEPESRVEERELEILRTARAVPRPYNITSCLQQLHTISKLLHTNHFILMELKQKFLFSFSMNLRKVRDLSMEQKIKLQPLWNAQEKYCRQLIAYHEVLDPGKTQIKTKLLLELRKILMIQAKLLCDGTASREEMIKKLEEIKGFNHLIYTKVEL